MRCRELVSSSANVVRFPFMVTLQVIVKFENSLQYTVSISFILRLFFDYAVLRNFSEP